MTNKILDIYDDLKEFFKIFTDINVITDKIESIFIETHKYLSNFDKVQLSSLVNNKEYFSFEV